MSCATAVVGMFPGVYGHKLAMVVIQLGLWVTSQVTSRRAQVCGLRHKSRQDVRRFVGYVTSHVKMCAGLWVTSQVMLRCAQVFRGYDVAQLFGPR